LEQLTQLDASLDPTSPVLMYVPDGVANIKWIKYFNSNPYGGGETPDNDYQHDLNTDITQDAGGFTNAPPGYQDVILIPNKTFIDRVTAFNTDADNVGTFTLKDGSGVGFKFNYMTDRQPEYATIIKNYYVVFDCYDNSQDDTLQSSKSMAQALWNPTWEMQDNFIPNLADEQFPLLLNEAKALAFFELKQQAHQLALKETDRGWSTVQKNKAVANRPTYFNEIPNYGRYGRGGYGVPSYFKLRGFDRP
jgi:hypothetical protein